MSARQAYYLMKVERETRKLPKLREAWVEGKVSFSNVRTLVGIANADDEADWLELAEALSYRQFWNRAKRVGHERAEKREAPWPETGIYGELGRPDPVRHLDRPYKKSLYLRESEVWELHNRFHGCHASWGGFTEAMLASYEQELQTALGCLAPMVREVFERDGFRCRIPCCSHRDACHKHHVAYRSRGGSDHPDNLVVLCLRCHALVHGGFLLVEGDAKSGFRFARREHLGDPWLYWPAEACKVEYLDPHAMAWDLEESGVFEERERPRREAWVGGPGPTRITHEANTGLPTSFVRSPMPRDGGRAMARLGLLVSERACSAPGRPIGSPVVAHRATGPPG